MKTEASSRSWAEFLGIFRSEAPATHADTLTHPKGLESSTEFTSDERDVVAYLNARGPMSWEALQNSEATPYQAQLSRALLSLVATGLVRRDPIDQTDPESPTFAATHKAVSLLGVGAP